MFSNSAWLIRSIFLGPETPPFFKIRSEESAWESPDSVTADVLSTNAGEITDLVEVCDFKVTNAGSMEMGICGIVVAGLDSACSTDAVAVSVVVAVVVGVVSIGRERGLAGGEVLFVCLACC